ncbi:hypothetical protein [Bradyrhizobium japonicum]|uniref:hypothetical protein n=1 Tax=Bradyrhizobium japonicum TaxID=375 RepID=UPI00209FB2B6|nr:hypothetical protein [Bradyrhizobium japonicum]MCP1783895.1 hypothetical protein [Bradyrhizobium japonicum]MCP1963817.1 hypothetical protein [Bradyrhizobium japonicum]
MRAVFAVIIVVLMTTLAQGAEQLTEWLLPPRTDCVGGAISVCTHSNSKSAGPGTKFESYAKQVYTVQGVEAIKAALEKTVTTTRTDLTTAITKHETKVTTDLDGHKTDVAGKLKGLITPELLAQIRKELVPEVTSPSYS